MGVKAGASAAALMAIAVTITTPPQANPRRPMSPLRVVRPGVRIDVARVASLRAKYPDRVVQGTLAPIVGLAKTFWEAHANLEQRRSGTTAPPERQAGSAPGAVGQAAGRAGRAEVAVPPGPDRAFAAPPGADGGSARARDQRAQSFEGTNRTP